MLLHAFWTKKLNSNKQERKRKRKLKTQSKENEHETKKETRDSTKQTLVRGRAHGLFMSVIKKSSCKIVIALRQ